MACNCKKNGTVSERVKSTAMLIREMSYEELSGLSATAVRNSESYDGRPSRNSLELADQLFRWSKETVGE